MSHDWYIVDGHTYGCALSRLRFADRRYSSSPLSLWERAG